MEMIGSVLIRYQTCFQSNDFSFPIRSFLELTMSFFSYPFIVALERSVVNNIWVIQFICFSATIRTSCGSCHV